INIGIIFTRLEFLIAGVWIVTVISRVIFYAYAGVLGFSQLFGIKDYKKIMTEHRERKHLLMLIQRAGINKFVVVNRE
ncbi:MAG: spore germination protein, partial [Spirochaetes bacterium]|nr:spore germination protein [Spirochaetota bacterium]